MVNSVHLIKSIDSNFACLFVLLLYVPVNSYGHGGTVSSHNHTFFLGKLEQAVNEYLVHIFSLVTHNNPSWMNQQKRKGGDWLIVTNFKYSGKQCRDEIHCFSEWLVKYTYIQGMITSGLFLTQATELPITPFKIPCSWEMIRDCLVLLFKVNQLLISEEGKNKLIKGCQK